MSEVSRPPRHEFLDIYVDSFDAENLVNYVVDSAENRKRVIIGNHNLHSLYLTHSRPDMQQFYRLTDTVHIDGTWILKIGRWCGHDIPGNTRTAYLDWIHPLLNKLTARHLRLYVVGGSKAVSDAFSSWVKGAYPNLEIELSNGYFDAQPESTDNLELIEKINGFKPHVLLVAMGMPRQELWVSNVIEKLDVGVVLTGGGILDYLVGETRTPPRWAGPLGVEWLFRLLWDPKRLAGRYIVEPLKMVPWLPLGILRERRKQRSR